jgi:hypothetical protein
VGNGRAGQDKEHAIDDPAFDRLSVAVHRLHNQAIRRGAQPVLLGGIAATGSSLG